MAKRAAPDARPYRPVQESLVRAVLSPAAPPSGPEASGDAVPSQPSPAGPSLEKFNREKRVLLTRSEERALEQLASAIGAEVETPVKLTNLLRAAVTLILHAEPEIVQRARQKGRLVRPANGDTPAMARFDRDLARIVTDGLRDSKPVR